jgi:2-oxoglutarate dehydrogenase E2 component (dihydrolipoamide succinyltransferase)
LTEIKVREGETVPINTIVALIGEVGEEAAAESPLSPAPAEEAGVAEMAEVAESASPSMAPEERAPATPEPGAASTMEPASDKKRLRSSPLVRRIAREHGVDLARVPGTGRDGRVTKADILDFIEKGPPTPEMPAPAETMVAEAAPRAPAPPPAAAVVAGPAGTTRAERVPMSVMRKSIAEHMLSSRRTSAHVATVFEADVTRIVTVREKNKDRYVREEGVKLTYTPFFIRAVVGGLKAFPIINASIEGDEIVYKKDINIGIAVALDWGLIVPVLKNADEKSFLKLNRDVSDLAERARTKKLVPEEVQGGTFTITNPGPYGGLFGLPIINQPQVAILGLGGIHKRPVAVNDAIAIRSMVYLALSFDHRLIDGATADQFMAEVKKRLENWEEKIL